MRPLVYRQAEIDLPPPASVEAHAERLVDVLLLADAIGTTRTDPLDYPRLDST